MTLQQIELVKNSWKNVIPIRDKAAELFTPAVSGVWKTAYVALSDAMRREAAITNTITVAVGAG
jgi:hypothetical protein